MDTDNHDFLHETLKYIKKVTNQTAVHRKKFEYFLSELEAIINMISDFMNNQRSFEIKLVNESFSRYLDSYISLIKKYIIQNWSENTLSEEPDVVLNFIIKILVSIRNTLIKYDERFSRIVIDNNMLCEYNILDLKAISASLSQFVQSDNNNVSMSSSVSYCLKTVNNYIEKNSSGEKEFSVISIIPSIYHNWWIDIDDYEKIDEIGKGASALVYKARNKKTGKIVAMKNFLFRKLNSSAIQSYQREVAVLASVQHYSVLKFVGYSDTNSFCVLTEWMNGGNLYNAIHQQGFLSPTDRTIAAFDIATAMMHLHSKNIVHRDLKSLNILLDDNKRIKICDFGFSRFAELQTQMNSRVGTPYWMAPELLTQNCFYTSKVDVYAYGIVLWELASSETPFKGADIKTISNKVSVEDLRPSLPKGLNYSMSNLVFQCWDKEPKNRPSFLDIVEMFEANEIIFDGSDKDVVMEYIKSKKKTGRRSMDIEKLIESFKNEDITADDFLEALISVDISEPFVNEVWNQFLNIKYTKVNRDLYIGFLNRYKRFNILNIARKIGELPPNFIDKEILKEIVLELPTGNNEADRWITLACCNNDMAEFAVLYSKNIDDIALCLEAISKKGAEVSLKYAVIDVCLLNMANINKSLKLKISIIKCLLLFEEVRKISDDTLFELLVDENPLVQELGILAYIQITKHATLAIPDNILQRFIDQNDKTSSLLLLACANNEANAQYMKSNLTNNHINYERIHDMIQKANESRQL